MWQLRDTAGRELRRLGSRLDAAVSVASDSHGLTDRERQVADHVAAGRTNKEIAALLFLSPKTIEHTLTRVYAKVGVRSRSGLNAALTRAA